MRIRSQNQQANQNIDLGRRIDTPTTEIDRYCNSKLTTITEVTEKNGHTDRSVYLCEEACQMPDCPKPDISKCQG